MQDLIVGLIVASCAFYAAWTLMPAAWRRRLAARALHLPLPAPWHARLGKLARSAPGCGCDGCDAAPPPGARPDGSRPVQFVRKPR